LLEEFENFDNIPNIIKDDAKNNIIGQENWK
jgi:hypothetical protein